MRSRFWFVSCAFLLLASGVTTLTLSATAAAAACPSNGARFEPADGKRLLLIGQERDANEAYVTGTGVVPAGFMSYTSYAAPLYGTALPGTLNGVTWGHAQQHIDRHPNTGVQLGLYLVDALDGINAGLYDSNFQSLATWARNTQRPVFLRIGYEFDLPSNHYDPAKFIAAWRRIVNLIRGQNAWNVAYVWHSWAGGPWQGLPYSSWYPGDAYVDWVAVSLFGQPWNNSFTHANNVDAFADAHGKPLMIAESTPIGAKTPTADANQLWSSWYVPTIDWANAHGVKAWSYINEDWEKTQFKGWGDSRVELNPQLKQLWLNEITQSSYLNSSPTLFCEIAL